MDQSCCEHLDLYEAQYVRTEASYRQFAAAVDALLVDGPTPETVRLVQQSLEEWSAEDGKLKEMLVTEVREGRVLVPRGLLAREGFAAKKSRRDARRRGRPVCAACRQAVPRITYPEWTIAHNGAATYRGEEFPPAAVAVPA